jgi:glutamyl-tRNA synthetase
VRTRFAPSPTGGLHLGGVRTALFSYLYAKHFNGDFILRIEDTDQTRYVDGAENYILQTLDWCGIFPDESPFHGGPHAPYRQSERKALYKQYALQLIEQGNAYYAFDTKQELEQMRERNKSESNPSPQYDASVRMTMRNSLSIGEAEVQLLLDSNTPYVVRIKVPQDQEIKFNDLIRGEVVFDSNTIDDKVLLKADGMPTYHLAVVVDDYLMQISHAFRGEEWLPSAPIHLLLWRYLGWGADMPAWAHLPLILKPDGNGKLSKRDGERLGFPVFAMDWYDAASNTTTIGFKERGYLPQAFVNILAMLGWNDGSDKELFSMQELCAAFDIERVHKGGAKFNIEKAQWYNTEYIKQMSEADFNTYILPVMKSHFANMQLPSASTPFEIFEIVKDRLTYTTDIATQAKYFYESPVSLALDAVRPKWNSDKQNFFSQLCSAMQGMENYTAASLEVLFKDLALTLDIKPGELQLPLRIMLVGDKFGPGVFTIVEKIGVEETISRVQYGLGLLN